MWNFGFGNAMDLIVQPEKGIGGIYLGSIDAAENIKDLKDKNIRAVLTVAADTNLNYDK